MDLSILNLEIVKGTTFGPVLIYCKDADGDPVPLAGWSAFAEARKRKHLPVLLDLTPEIAVDDADGLVTIPEKAWEITAALPEVVAQWDLILQDPTGRPLPPFVGGSLTITRSNTRKPL